MVEDVFSGETFGGDGKINTDEYEQGDQYIIEMELPGVKKSDLNLQVIDGVLQVKGTKHRSATEGKTFHRQERRFGDFSRSFPLPGYVKLEKIKAAFDEGILTITFGKTEPSEDEQTSIEIE